ncbi:hypothetical protein Tco_1499569 [Tanacetum coccineum]
MSNTNTNLPTQTSSVLHNDTISSCSTSKVQEKTQLSRSRCMNSLRAIQSQFKFLTETLQDFGTMSIFKRTFSQDLDLLEQHLTKETISQTDCKTILTKLRTTFENAFNSEFKARMQKYTRFDAQSLYDAMIFNMDSIGKYMLEITLHQQRTPQLLKQKKLMQTQEDHSNPIPALNVDSLKVDLVVIQNTCSEKEDSNSETASSKSVKESSLDSATKDCALSKEDLKGTRIEHGFKRAFMSLCVVKCRCFHNSGIESEVQDDNSMSWNDTDANNADIRPIYDEEPMAKYPEQCQVKNPMLDSSPDNQTTEYSKQSLESENILLKKTIAQFQKDFSRMEAHCIALELNYQNQSLKSGQHGQLLNETSNKAKIKKEIDVLETMNIELEHSVAKLRKENETLDISKNIAKIIVQMHVIDHYLDETRKKTQKRDRNSKTNVIPSARFQRTVDGSKPKPRSINHSTRSLPCVFNANHDACITKLLKEVNSHAKIQSYKTRNSNKPVDQKSHTQKPGRQIFTRHMFSPNKTSVVYEKTSPRSDLRWKPTGRILKSVGLRWIPIGKLFDSCTSKVDSEPPHG